MMISLSFGATGEFFVVTEAFPEYVYLYFCRKAGSQESCVHVFNP